MDEDLSRVEAMLGEAIALLTEALHKRPSQSSQLRSALTQLDAAHFWVGWASRHREENTPPLGEATGA